MCNAANRRIPLIAAIAAVAAASCGKGGGSDREMTGADSLVLEVRAAYESGSYTRAKTLIDSLNRTYPEAVEARREVTGIMPRVMLGYIEEQIEEADFTLDQARARVDALEPLMRHIENEDGGYYVAAGCEGPCAVQPRVDDELYTYRLSVRTDGTPLGTYCVGLVSGEERYMSLPIPAGSERSFSMDGTEMATLLEDEVEGLAQWALAHRPVTAAVISGPGGSRDIKLTAQQGEAFGTAWEYAEARKALRSALINREKLERQRMTAQAQVEAGSAP